MRSGYVAALAFAAALGTNTCAGALTLTGPTNTGVDVSGGYDQAWSITSSVYNGQAYYVLNSARPLLATPVPGLPARLRTGTLQPLAPTGRG